MEFTFKRNRDATAEIANVRQIRERFLVLVGFVAATLITVPNFDWDDTPYMLFAVGMGLSLLNTVLLLVRPKWRTLSKQSRRPYVLGSFGITIGLLFVFASFTGGVEVAYVFLFGGGAIVYLLYRWMGSDSAEKEEDNLFV